MASVRLFIHKADVLHDLYRRAKKRFFDCSYQVGQRNRLMNNTNNPNIARILKMGVIASTLYRLLANTIPHTGNLVKGLILR